MLDFIKKDYNQIKAIPPRQRWLLVLLGAMGLCIQVAFAASDVRVVGSVELRDDANGVAAGVQIYGSTSTTGTPIAVPLDAATNSIQTVTYEHHEIHSGSHYSIEDSTDLAINNVFDLQFVTPDTTKWVHLTWQLSSESELEWYVYEDAVIITSGTAVSPINNNRNSANTSGVLPYMIVNTSLALANADTDVSAATQLAHGISGSGRVSGADSRDHELILKQNTKYAFRGIANAAGYVSFDMSWYEHTNKN